jgi:hypothetical protein
MPYTLSPSKLSLMQDCPRCFWLALVKNIRRPDGIFPSLPAGMDRILKAHFDSFRDKGELPPELKKENLDSDVKLFNNTELLDVWRNNFQGLRFVDSEGNVLMGAVDNILQKGSKLIVLDYKTKGSPIKDGAHDDYKGYYQNQLDTYNFLLRKNGHDTEDYAYLLVYHPNKVSENGDVIFYTHLIKVATNTNNAEQLFQKALAILKQPAAPEPAPECGWCEWGKVNSS